LRPACTAASDSTRPGDPGATRRCVTASVGDGFKQEGLVLTDVTSTSDTPEVPVHDGQDAIERAYTSAEQEGVPFVAIEHYEDGYAFTYDLLPAGERLTPPMRKEVQVRLTDTLEDIVRSDETRTVEVSKSVNDSLGHVSLLASEAEARQIARAVAPVVLDRANWVEE
jgi:hypothetical protein